MIEDHLLLGCVVEDPSAHVFEERLDRDADPFDFRRNFPREEVKIFKFFREHHDVHVDRRDFVQELHDVEEVIALPLFRMKRQADVIDQVLVRFPELEGPAPVGNETDISAEALDEAEEFTELLVVGNFPTREFKEDAFIRFSLDHPPAEVLHDFDVRAPGLPVVKNRRAIRAREITNAEEAPVNDEITVVGRCSVDKFLIVRGHRPIVAYPPGSNKFSPLPGERSRGIIREA